MLNRIILAAGALAFAVAVAAPLAAPTGAGPQSVIQEGTSLHFDALGHRITMPFPDWLVGAELLSPDVVSLVEANYFGDPAQAFVEFFPKGESVHSFTTTYSARMTIQPGRSLADYRQATIVGYSSTCKPEATGAFLFGEETPDFFPALAFICGAYLDSIPGLKGLGEVMVSVFRKTDQGVAVIYQEWRGPAFNPYEPAGWPISPELLEARANQLQADAKFFAAE
jgi:hypothetical protein